MKKNNGSVFGWLIPVGVIIALIAIFGKLPSLAVTGGIVMGALLLLMLLLFFFAAFKAAHCADEQQEWECAAWHAAHSQSNPDTDGSGV